MAPVGPSSCHLYLPKARSSHQGRFGNPYPAHYAGLVSSRPKDKCCSSKPRCKRCPIRMLADGRLSSSEAKKIFASGRNRKELKKAGLKKAA